MSSFRLAFFAGLVSSCLIRSGGNLLLGGASLDHHPRFHSPLNVLINSLTLFLSSPCNVQCEALFLQST